MSIELLLSTLRADVEIKSLLKSLSNAIQSRNTAPMRIMQYYSGKAIEGDQLTQDYSKLLALIMPIVQTVDFSTVSSIRGKREFQALNNSIWFIKTNDEEEINLSLFNQYLVAILLEQEAPHIDEYIEAVRNTDLHKELEIPYDDNYLVDISTNKFELKKHGLVVDNDLLVYPHQFMRRFYSANFVDLLSILAYCKKKDMLVKIRLDPLRGYCDPRFYQDLMEADYWHGKPFSDEMLMDKEKKEIVTFHRNDKDLESSPYPIKYTIFRSSMMDSEKGLRQFMVEEYTPSVNLTESSSLKSPSFGNQYCIQKFAHFVYDQNKLQFTHIDGATRTFSVEDYRNVEAIVSLGKDPGSKIGTRDKLFLVEGEIEKKLMFDLLYEYFRYNPHLEEYYVENAKV